MVEEKEREGKGKGWMWVLVPFLGGVAALRWLVACIVVSSHFFSLGIGYAY